MALNLVKMFAEHRGPALVSAPDAGDLGELIERHRDAIEDSLLEHGALLFRGFKVATLSAFDTMLAALKGDRLDYRYGSTPRTSVGNGIFTATEYPPAQEIPMHCENAYQLEWPLKIALACLLPARVGGQTPIADMRRVSAAIGPQLMEKFERLRVRYVRHYNPNLDVPWQKVFGTDDRTALARFCAEQSISHTWLGETLRTEQVCQGTAVHPVTGERAFFNQAHLFHLSSLGEAPAAAMLQVFGDRLPRQSYFGDGTDIPAEDLRKVREAFTAHAFAFDWQAGDVLLVDNMQFAHGRRPFQGPRKVLAALLHSYRNS